MAVPTSRQASIAPPGRLGRDQRRDLTQRQLLLNLAHGVAGARKAAGLTQAQLANRAELARATVHLVEAGACDPRLSTIVRLADALDLRPLDLLDRAADHAAADNNVSGAEDQRRAGSQQRDGNGLLHGRYA